MCRCQRSCSGCPLLHAKLGGDGWIVCIFTYSILDVTVALLLMFIRFFNTLKLPAVCTVFFQQYEFGLRLCTLQGGAGAAVSHPHSYFVTLSPRVFSCNWGGIRILDGLLFAWHVHLWGFSLPSGSLLCLMNRRRRWERGKDHAVQ